MYQLLFYFRHYRFKTMKVFIFISIIFLEVFAQSIFYEESLNEMLLQCNLYQHEITRENRTKHLCEKPDFDDDYSYFISSMETKFSKRKFMCFLFFKDESFKMKFKLWFSHANYTANAYGVKFYKPAGDKWETMVKFKISSAIIVPNKGSVVPQIFGFEINGVDKCPYCGQRLQSIALIAQGHETAPAKWPWHAALFYQESFNLAYKCGGSIIRENVVLTAAHCVTNAQKKLSENIMKIRIEQAELLSSSSHQFNVFKSNVHEKYDHQTFENDIALLMLESKIQFTTRVQAICLPQIELPNQGTATAVGFGSTEKSTDHSNVLREVEIPIVSHEVCLDSDVDFFSHHLFSTNFCAGKIGVQKGVCQGDSGGGLYVESDKLWFLKGITSFTKQNTRASNPSCNDASYAIFTDVNKYLGWIDEKIKFMRN